MQLSVSQPLVACRPVRMVNSARYWIVHAPALFGLGLSTRRVGQFTGPPSAPVGDSVRRLWRRVRTYLVSAPSATPRCPMPTFFDSTADAAEASEALRGLAQASQALDQPAQMHGVIGDLSSGIQSLHHSSPTFTSAKPRARSTMTMATRRECATRQRHQRDRAGAAVRHPPEHRLGEDA